MTLPRIHEPDPVPFRALKRSPARRQAELQVRLVLIIACLGCASAFVAAMALVPHGAGGCETALLFAALGFIVSMLAAQRVLRS